MPLATARFSIAVGKSQPYCHNARLAAWSSAALSGRGSTVGNASTINSGSLNTPASAHQGRLVPAVPKMTDRPIPMESYTAKSVAPYGTWKSPISADLLTKKNVSFGEIAILSATETHASIAYVENRPQESGRAALLIRRIPLDLLSLVRQGGGDVARQEIDVTQGKLNTRSGLHEYGGGAIAPASDGNVLLTDYKTFDVFVATRDGQSLNKITPDNKAHRFADFSSHPTLPIVAAILEDHTEDLPSKVVNSIACIDTHTKDVHTIVSGYDFYTSPRFSPDGQYIAWVCWNHPSMPFWATELWVAKFEPGACGAEAKVSGATKIAGNNQSEVAHYPLWSSDRTLLFSRDVSGFANPFTVDVKEDGNGEFTLGNLKPVLKNAIEADFTSPAWQVNTSTYALLSKDWLACALSTKGLSSLCLLHLPTGTLKHLSTPFVAVDQLRALSPTMIVFMGAQDTEPSALIAMDVGHALKAIDSRADVIAPNWNVIKRSSSVVSDGTVDSDYLGKAEPIAFPTELPSGKQATAYALLFSPSNPDYAAPAGTSPPCIVKIHGGPTSRAPPGANLGISYWTSRGYAVCHVNYGGSTSYGREYMERLNGQWGVVDVRDAAAAASFLGSRDHGKHNGKAARRITSTAQAELGALEEKHLSGGGVEFTLQRPLSWWKQAAESALVVAAGAASAFLPGADARLGLLAGGIAGLLATVARVQEESVMAIPGVGIQLRTVRGFYLPRPLKTDASPKLVRTLVQGKLIPRDCILDIFTNEAFRRWRVTDYLAVATQAPRKTAASSEVEKGHPVPATKARGGSLEVLFRHTQPRLPVVEHVFQSIYPAIFDRDVNEASVHNTAQALPRVDAKRIAISGGSAGGFTVLASLCLYPSVFKAGTSLYGVSRILGLAESSHKFESEYVNRLMGGAPDEIPQIYHDRSPLYMADRIRAPVILMQGDIDKVVPPEQSEAIFDVLQKQGVKTKYLVFEGEGHGFRKAENIKKSLLEEEAWYKDVFGL